jgi:hypothetical protein
MKGEKMLNRRILLSSAVLFAAAGQSRADSFSDTGSIVTFIVPATGTYDITAVGAGGGGGEGGLGGAGASVADSFSLSAGETLSILVGGEGGDGGAFGPGGGGGTFVIAPGNVPLLIAGAGGGSGDLGG